MTTLLADLGGTHIRLAHIDAPYDVTRYKIADYGGFEDVAAAYGGSYEALYLASATGPVDGIIEDRRFSDKGGWRTDLPGLKQRLGLHKLYVANDLAAAAHALGGMGGAQLAPLLKPFAPQTSFDHPPKLLIGVGTGIGHAFYFDKPGGAPFVQQTHGGHVPALAATEEQADILRRLDAHKKHERDIIVEDVVSAHGLRQMAALIPEDQAVRLFWEFLGLYCCTITGLAASYGGIYLTGGVIDEMTEKGKVDMNSFEKFFLRPLVPAAIGSLSSVAVYYCAEHNMPILGLAELAKREDSQ